MNGRGRPSPCRRPRPDCGLRRWGERVRSGEEARWAIDGDKSRDGSDADAVLTRDRRGRKSNEACRVVHIVSRRARTRRKTHGAGAGCHAAAHAARRPPQRAGRAAPCRGRVVVVARARASRPASCRGAHGRPGGDLARRRASGRSERNAPPQYGRNQIVIVESFIHVDLTISTLRRVTCMVSANMRLTCAYFDICMRGRRGRERIPGTRRTPTLPHRSMEACVSRGIWTR